MSNGTLYLNGEPYEHRINEQRIAETEVAEMSDHILGYLRANSVTYAKAKLVLDRAETTLKNNMNDVLI